MPLGLRTTVYRDMLREHNMYVGCQTTDDLPLVIRYAGDNHLVVGTDYGHADFSNDLGAMREIAEKGEIDAISMDKIVSKNPRKLYGL